MKRENTKELAREWIESGNPCIYRYGWRYRGAGYHVITKEKALELLPRYSFGIGFYKLGWINDNGVDYLEFNELSENDMW